MNYLIFKHPMDSCWNITGTKYGIYDDDLLNRDNGTVVFEEIEPSKNPRIGPTFEAWCDCTFYHRTAIQNCIEWIFKDALSKGLSERMTIKFHIDGKKLKSE